MKKILITIIIILVIILIVFAMIFFSNGDDKNKNLNTNTAPTTCTEEWECSQWGKCLVTSLQTRTCIDFNSCGTATLKPETSMDCEFVPKEDSDDDEITIICTDSDTGKNYNVRGGVTCCVTGSEDDGCALHEDICEDQNNLREYYIQNQELKSIEYTCDDVCNSGKCVTID